MLLALGTWSLNHWTAREVHQLESYFKDTYKVQACTELHYYLLLANSLKAVMPLDFISRATDTDTIISCLELLIISRAGAGNDSTGVGCILKSSGAASSPINISSLETSRRSRWVGMGEVGSGVSDALRGNTVQFLGYYYRLWVAVIRIFSCRRKPWNAVQTINSKTNKTLKRWLPFSCGTRQRHFGSSLGSGQSTQAKHTFLTRFYLQVCILFFTFLI